MGNILSMIQLIMTLYMYYYYFNVLLSVGLSLYIELKGACDPTRLKKKTIQHNFQNKKISDHDSRKFL